MYIYFVYILINMYYVNMTVYFTYVTFSWNKILPLCKNYAYFPFQYFIRCFVVVIWLHVVLLSRFVLLFIASGMRASKLVIYNGRILRKERESKGSICGTNWVQASHVVTLLVLLSLVILWLGAMQPDHAILLTSTNVSLRNIKRLLLFDHLQSFI